MVFTSPTTQLQHSLKVNVINMYLLIQLQLKECLTSYLTWSLKNGITYVNSLILLKMSTRKCLLKKLNGRLDMQRVTGNAFPLIYPNLTSLTWMLLTINVIKDNTLIHLIQLNSNAMGFPYLFIGMT